MVRPTAKEDDLFALAAKGGTPEADKEEGVSLKPVFLGAGPRGINEPGDPNDLGFETRVKAPGKAEKKPADKGPGRPRGNATERSMAEIQDAIQEKFDEAFAVISIGLPVTGTYGVENSEKAVKALMSIAKRRPKLLGVLMKVADGADGIDIGRYFLGVVVALQVDMQRLPADSLPARVTGVTAVVEKYFTDDEDIPNPNVTEQVTHARFQPVS